MHKNNSNKTIFDQVKTNRENIIVQWKQQRAKSRNIQHWNLYYSNSQIQLIIIFDGFSLISLLCLRFTIQSSDTDNNEPTLASQRVCHINIETGRYSVHVLQNGTIIAVGTNFCSCLCCSYCSKDIIIKLNEKSLQSFGMVSQSNCSKIEFLDVDFWFSCTTCDVCQKMQINNSRRKANITTIKLEKILKIVPNTINRLRFYKAIYFQLRDFYAFHKHFIAKFIENP